MLKITAFKQALEQRLTEQLTALGIEIKRGAVQRFLQLNPSDKLLIIQDGLERINDSKPSSYNAERELILVLALPWQEDADNDLEMDGLLHKVRCALAHTPRHEWWATILSNAPKQSDATAFTLPDTGENWNLAAITLTVSYTQPH